jgi:catechol 2,3-dioxygenase
LIAPDTTIGTVRLTVADLDRSQMFYERSLGMSAAHGEGGTLELRPGSGGGRPLLELTGDPAAPPPGPRSTGLFHLAVLVPTRLELARALARLAHTRWPLDGASDHLVSEALYLSDPDGNGIEIYRDRPREDWPRDERGIEMATLPLDIRGVLGELPDDARAALSNAAGSSDFDATALAGGTRIGHVHLKVAQLPVTEAFYAGVLGFDVMQRSYPGALFVAAGGYHHHIGLNTWQSAGASAPPAGAIGLRSFELRLPDDASLRALLGRVEAAGLSAEQLDDGPLVRDPSGNVLLLTAG